MSSVSPPKDSSSNGSSPGRFVAKIFTSLLFGKKSFEKLYKDVNLSDIDQKISAISAEIDTCNAEIRKVWKKYPASSKDPTQSKEQNRQAREDLLKTWHEKKDNYFMELKGLESECKQRQKDAMTNAIQQKISTIFGSAPPPK